ncbi:MAG: F0F1 ATP synthase subunit A [Candidatus Zixiibacteriota bacterium]|nr:MAG: F0F1 ATP synthase subunit A [candidate division Zixibacteria bacterium]
MILERLTFPILTMAEGAGRAAADTVAHVAKHGESSAPELPNILQMLYLGFGDAFKNLYHWENIFFAFAVLAFLCIVSLRIYTKRQPLPGKLQNLAEMIVEALDNFFTSILGHHARRYTPFLGTLFIYILLMNWIGMIPFLKSPSSYATIPVSLALIVFVYVQYTGFRRLGVWGWVFHIMGSPKDAVSWALVPLNLPIHLIGELAKPLSLSLRLFGNITGEDVLIAAFTGLGVMVLSFAHLPIGIPLQLPFYFLGLLMSTIQALVFASLATIYISMMLPHEEHGEER